MHVRRSFGAPTRVALIALSTLLAGCFDWSQPSFGPAHTRYNADDQSITVANVASLDTLWEMPSTASLSEPIVVGERVFTTVYGSPPSVRAYDVATGSLLWETPVAAGFGGPTSVTASGDSLLVGDGEGALQRLDPATGAVLQTVPVGVPGLPVTAGDYVVSVDSIGRPGALQLTVRDRETFVKLWIHEFASVGLPSEVPTVADGRIYISRGSTLMAFELAGCGAATCSPLWTRQFYAPPSTAIAGPGGEIFLVVTRQRENPHGGGTFTFAEVHAIDGATGVALWQQLVEGAGSFTSTAPGGVAGLAARGDTLYLTAYRYGYDDPLQAHDIEAFAAGGCAGAPCRTWQAVAPTGQLVGTGEVVFSLGTIYPDPGTVLQAFAAAGCGGPTCTALASLPVPGAPVAISVADGRVFVVTSLPSGEWGLTAFGVP